MAKQDMNRMVENFFAKKENLISESLLEELVRQQFKKTLLKEQENPKRKNFAVSYSSLPEISVSELGWSALKTTESGEEVPSEQRRQLENYLNNIQGASLEEKIGSINKIFQTKSIDDLMTMGIIKSDSRTSKIQQILSYLVFMKTLTTIITNFNAASAGFAFESFLGVLLGGKQVPTNSGTIADLTTGDGIGISLKLYSEAGVHVGGSFTDLVNDMAKPKNPSKPFIRYVIAIKSLSGKGLEAEGTIAVYQFDINIDNIFDVMMVASGESREAIRLPKLFIDSNGATDFSHLKKILRPEEEIKAEFDKKMRRDFGDEPKFEEWYRRLIHAQENNYKFFAKGKVGRPSKLGSSEAKISELNSLFQKFADEGLLETPEVAVSKKQFVSDITGKRTKIWSYANQVAEIYKYMVKFASEPVQEKDSPQTSTPSTIGEVKNANAKQASADSEGGGTAPDIQYETTEASYNYYKNVAKTPQQKAAALKNTFGYLDTMQFGMTRNQVDKVIEVTGQKGLLGVLKIGRKNVEEVLSVMKEALDTEVYEIFQSLAVLTQGINTYFATGLKNDQAADQAQEAAINIDKRTEEIQAKAKPTG